MGEKQNASQKDACAHRWDIEPPNGEMSLGTCKRCGQEKEFRNTSEVPGGTRLNASQRAFAASNLKDVIVKQGTKWHQAARVGGQTCALRVPGLRGAKLSDDRW